MLCLLGRSATIAAAYVMYSKNVDVQTAIGIIQKARPVAQHVSLSFSIFQNLTSWIIRRPNEGFMAQLEIFYQASFKVSKRDKATRMFYLERAVEEILSKSI